MPHRSGLSQDELRRANLSSLLGWVHSRGPTTRAVLTMEMGLNRSTIGDLTSQLTELGLVSEEASSGSRRSGRPSLLVTARRDVTVLAVLIDVDRITLALVGLGGEELKRLTRTHHRGEKDVTKVLRTVRTMARRLLADPAAGRCVGAGISVPGAVRASTGVVRFAPNLGWSNVELAERMEHTLQLPVVVGNDGNLGVLAEHLRGAGRNTDDVAYIAGSVGIGGGFLTGGVPLQGADGYAGEVGHLIVDSNGPVCQCGAIGCWETKVGENSLLRLAGRPLGGGSEAVAEVIAADEQGDERAGAALDEVAFWTGRGLRAVVNVFNPAVVVLGGLLAQTYRVRAELLMQGLDPDTLIAPREKVEVVAAHFGEDSSLFGAAELAFAPLLADPLVLERTAAQAGSGSG